jgi:hypothetical protein
MRSMCRQRRFVRRLFGRPIRHSLFFHPQINLGVATYTLAPKSCRLKHLAKYRKHKQFSPNWSISCAQFRPIWRLLQWGPARDRHV